MFESNLKSLNTEGHIRCNGPIKKSSTQEPIPTSALVPKLVPTITVDQLSPLMSLALAPVNASIEQFNSMGYGHDTVIGQFLTAWSQPIQSQDLKSLIPWDKNQVPYQMPTRSWFNNILSSLPPLPTMDQNPALAIQQQFNVMAGNPMINGPQIMETRDLTFVMATPFPLSTSTDLANLTAPSFLLAMDIHQILDSRDLTNLMASTFPLATNVSQSTDPAYLMASSFLPAMNSFPFQLSGQSVQLGTSVQRFPFPNLEPPVFFPAKNASASTVVLPTQTHSEKENDLTGVGKV
jgi:hypothetical protein